MYFKPTDDKAPQTEVGVAYKQSWKPDTNSAVYGHM